VAPIAATSIAAAQERPSERVSPAPEVNPKAVVWRTAAPPATPQAGDVWVNPKDNAEMIYVAAGEFLLGTSDAQVDSWLKEHPGDMRELFKDEQPQCRVNLPGYWIGRTEVTNAQYLRFALATRHRAPGHWEGGQIPSGLDDFPVEFVYWEDAQAYCEWAGGRLPIELEWEKAARGTDGRMFPWGNQWDSKRCRNFELLTGKPYTGGEPWAEAAQAWLDRHEWVREGPVAAGSYPAAASPYGCLDMAGNVWEWCADWYDEKAYERYAHGDLTSPRTGEDRVIRGGSWGAQDPRQLRSAFRFGVRPRRRINLAFYGLGFRCARGLP
jgi:formylglycine-generating enzyme required for sulfatase activity